MTIEKDNLYFIGLLFKIWLICWSNCYHKTREDEKCMRTLILQYLKPHRWIGHIRFLVSNWRISRLSAPNLSLRYVVMRKINYENQDVSSVKTSKDTKIYINLYKSVIFIKFQ